MVVTAIIVCMLVVALGAAWDSPAVAGHATLFTVQYGGSYEFTDSFSSGATSLTTTQILHWNDLETFSVRGNVVSERAGALSISGSLDQTGSSVPPTHCTYSAYPHAPLGFTLLVIGAGSSPEVSVGVGIPAQAGAQVFLTGTGLDCINPSAPGTRVLLSDERSSGGVNLNFTPKEQIAFVSASQPGMTYPIDQLPKTIPVGASAMASGPHETMSRELSGVFRVSLGGPRSPTLVSTPKSVRDFAQAIWQRQYPIYLAVILLLNQTLASVNVNLQFVPFSGAQVVINQYVNSDFVQAAALPALIDAYNKMTQMLLALDAAYNDPPRAGYRSPAPVAKVTPYRFRPSSCTHIPAGKRGFCTRLQQTAAAWLDATARLDALARALATDVGRESAAAHAGDQQAVSLQRNAELGLLPRLRSARVAQRSAGARLAASLRAIHVDITVTPAQTATGIRALLTRFAARGVNGSEVSAILGKVQLTPQALSFDNLIGR